MGFRVWRIGLIGFGNVGQGFTKILASKGGAIRSRYGVELKIVGVADPAKGSVFDPNGLDIAMLVNLVERYGNIRGYPGGEKGIDSLYLCRSDAVDIVVEVTPTNIETGEPGLTYIREALRNRKHVVTTNKGPIALAYPELKRLAQENRVFLRFEGVVLSGTPVFSLALEAMAGVDIKRVQGIVNGTTNFILTKMEEGMTYEEALREAQRLGYAEADPTLDVEGWDAAIKTVILANVLMGGSITLRDVDREGITGITLDDVMKAKAEGYRIKLVAEVTRENSSVRASVKPRRIPLTHPLANILGATNALTFETDHLGQVTIVGPGAGRIETGQAILSDILAIYRYTTGGFWTP